MQKMSAPSCYTMLMVTGLSLIIYNEYLEFYLLKQSQWVRARESILQPTRSSQAQGNEHPETQHDPVRILFVGDPQIQGYKDEPALLGYITRWDADMYLRKYFYEAYYHIQPDVIITMGDLIDEGSISSEAEFEIYAARFKKLFAVPEKSKCVFIHLSGDNDIGGEGSDPITENKQVRFEEHFGPMMEVVPYKHIAFFKLNLLPYLHAVDKEKDILLERELHEMAEKSKESAVRIVISHIGMANTMVYRHIQILRILKPQYAFSAHSHHSGFTRHNLSKLMEFFKNVYKTEHRAITDLTTEEKNLVVDEYKIPTCSYRMGVQHMAYTAAVVDSDGKLHFTTLVLPSRFKQLYRYAVFGVFAGVVLIWAVLTVPRWRRY